jgi:hypothetical protein
MSVACLPWRTLSGLLLALALAEVHGRETHTFSPGPDHEIRVIALSGQSAPDGRGIIAGLRTSAPLLNNLGQLLFIADVHAPEVDIDAHVVLRSDRPGMLLQLLRTSDALPGGASFGWLRSGEDICLSNAGQAAVYVPVDAEDRPLNVIYRVAEEGGIAVVHDADRLAGLARRFELTDSGGIEFEPDGTSRPVFNARGQVVFAAQGGIFLAEPDGTISSIVRPGDELAGGRVIEVLFAGGEPCRSGFNDAGQVAFYARLSTGEGEGEGVFLADNGG